MYNNIIVLTLYFDEFNAALMNTIINKKNYRPQTFDCLK